MFCPIKRPLHELSFKCYLKTLYLGPIIIFTLLGTYANLAYSKDNPLCLTKGEYFWNPEIDSDQPDTHAAFRGSFILEKTTTLEYRILGASVFTVWLDGHFLTEGPARFSTTNPEYQVLHFKLPKGRHILALQVHHLGVATRILGDQPPFVWNELEAHTGIITVKWLTSILQGYSKAVRRINPQLGWIEWCDTRKNPTDWQSTIFDDHTWVPACIVKRDLCKAVALETSNLHYTRFKGTLIDFGYLTERFGYEKDNPSARFYLRDLAKSKNESTGIWRRYDLGRIRILRPEFKLSLPEGAIVEWALSEQLFDNRVSPWITLSGGDSCNLNHFVARGGIQDFTSLSENGGRFLELHIIGDPDKIKVIDEDFIDRGYFSEIIGEFKTQDPILNAIWNTGVETLKSCSEDAIIDNPTRERGQWTGDLTIGLDTTSVAFNDLALCKRGLIQSAQCARNDGLVSGMSPGQNIFISSYAAQWVDACVHYWEMTGDLKFLQSLYPAAVKNIRAFESQRTADGIKKTLSWDFIDWGYKNDSLNTDQALNLFYLSALKSMARWSKALSQGDGEMYYLGLADKMTSIINSYFNSKFSNENDCWNEIGFHRTVLGLKLDLFKGTKKQEAIAAIKQHILGSFPNTPTAPHLSDPSVTNTQLITPYFGQFTFDTLLRVGETDFVLNQFKTCWGWELNKGQTTWMEVYDTHWSGCHQWSACPTWQLSRWILGVKPHFDLGIDTYSFDIRTGSLTQAEGRIPYHNHTGAMHIKWNKNGITTHVHIDTSEPITLHIKQDAETRIIRILGSTDFNI